MKSKWIDKRVVTKVIYNTEQSTMYPIITHLSISSVWGVACETGLICNPEIHAKIRTVQHWCNMFEQLVLVLCLLFKTGWLVHLRQTELTFSLSPHWITGQPVINLFAPSMLTRTHHTHQKGKTLAFITRINIFLSG